MRIRFLFMLLLTAMISSKSPGQKVIVEGENPEYSGESFRIYTISNPFTGATKTLDTLYFDDQGAFRACFEAEPFSWISMNMGALRTILLVEPGNLYRVYLPPRREITETDKRNPYFEPLRVHLRVKEQRSLPDSNLIKPPSDLNTRIFRFDTLIFARNKELMEARRKNKEYHTDSLVQTVEQRYRNDTSGYFERYRHYRYGLLQINSGDKKLKYLHDQYLRSPVPALANPAYMELFNKMYDKFLFFFARTPAGNNLLRVINREHNLQALRKNLRNHPAIPSDTIADLVILKEVKEHFYEDYFYKEALLIILDSLQANPSMPSYTKLARGVHEKLTNLMIGTPPPGFSLSDRNGISKSLSDFKGKYIYLNFCSPDNYTCMMEYPYLESMYRKHKEYLDIVTIMIAESHEKMVQFMKRNDYHWETLYFGNDYNLLESYNVRAYPTSYLIGPDGKLIQSPATLPSEGFEEQLFRIMRTREDL